MRNLFFFATVVLLPLISFGNTSTDTISITLKPGPIDGQDAIIMIMEDQCTPSDSYYTDMPENMNFGDTEDLTYYAWTFNEIHCGKGYGRSLIKFVGLDTLPTTANIVSAELKFYGVDEAQHMQRGNSNYPINPYHTSNKGYLYKVNPGTSNYWEESTVTWNSALSITLDNNPIELPVSKTQWNWDLVIDDTELTNMLQSMIGSNNNNGFMLMLQDEETYRAVNFASSDHSNPYLWPELIINYVDGPISINENILGNNVEVYPNPTNGNWNLSFTAQQQETIQIALYDVSGRKVFDNNYGVNVGSNLINLKTENLSKGIYFLQMNGKHTNIQKKMIKQ